MPKHDKLRTGNGDLRPHNTRNFIFYISNGVIELNDESIVTSWHAINTDLICFNIFHINAEVQIPVIHCINVIHFLCILFHIILAIRIWQMLIFVVGDIGLFILLSNMTYDGLAMQFIRPSIANQLTSVSTIMVNTYLHYFSWKAALLTRLISSIREQKSVLLNRGLPF